MSVRRIIKMLVVICFSFSTLAIQVFAGSSNRGLGISGKDSGEAGTSEFYRKSWAVIIGINKYKKWPQLEYAVYDAKGMKDALKKYGFTNFIELYDENATKDNILRVLGDDMGDEDKVSEEDRVLVFFAGHGQTRALPNGRSLGYIIPVDADVENYHSTAISMTNLRDFCDLIPAKHLLFVMDSCYSGLALTTRGGTNPKMRNYVAEISRRRARQIITAGGSDEEVADGGPNNHSVFTGFLLRGLDEQLADMDGNGVITATELSAYLTPQVKSYSNQTPAFGNLVGNEGGDFIFLVPDSGGSTSESQTSAEEIAYKAATSQNTIEGWEKFLDNFPKGTYAEDASLSLKILKGEKSTAELAEQARLAKEIEKKRVYLMQLEEKAFQNARQANTLDSWQSFVKSYPNENDDHVTYAKRQIDALKKPKKESRPKPTPVPTVSNKKFELFHDAPAFAFGGAKKAIQVEVEGNRKLIKSAKLFYSHSGKSGYKAVDMEISRGSLVGTIPKQALAPGKTIQYYIEVSDINGKITRIASAEKPNVFKVKKPMNLSVAPVINF